MNSLSRSVFPKFTELMSDQFYKELVNSECLTNDVPQDFNENVYDLNELEEVFADHLLMGKRLQKSLYGGNLEDLNDDTDHPPIALTDLALKLFSKAVPNYGLDLLDMDYVSSVSEATRVSPCAMILALIYLERLQAKNCDYLESVSPPGLFVVTMLVASKFLFENEDDIVTNQIWADALNVDVKELNRLEQKFLAAIDWKLYVDSSEYFRYLSGVEKMIAVKQSSLRGWLSYSDAYSILQDAAVRKFLLSCIERIIKVSAISALGYVMTVISVCAAGFAIHNKCIKDTSPSDQTVHMNNNVQLHSSLSRISSVELTSGTKLADKSSELDSVLNTLSLSNRYSYEDKDSIYTLQSKKLKDISYNLKKLSTVVCSNALPSFKEKSLHNAYLSNTSLESKIIINHTLYNLQLWSNSFKNSCIPVLIK